jgi:hypothetical protein
MSVRRFVAAALLAGCLVSCSGEAAPAQTSYELNFPSVSAAANTDTVQMLVFEALSGSARANQCASLIRSRASKQPLKPAIEGPITRICDLTSGTRGTVETPFGDRVLLVIAQRNKEDYLLGCTVQSVGATALPAAIFLSPANPSAPFVPSTCKTLDERCRNACASE